MCPVVSHLNRENKNQTLPHVTCACLRSNVALTSAGVLQELRGITAAFPPLDLGDVCVSLLETVSRLVCTSLHGLSAQMCHWRPLELAAALLFYGAAKESRGRFRVPSKHRHRGPGRKSLDTRLRFKRELSLLQHTWSRS